MPTSQRDDRVFGRLSTEAGEGALVAGVQGSAVATATTTRSAAGSTTLTTTSTTLATAATGGATSTTGTTTGAVLLLETVVDVDNSLLLALTLTLGLATAGGNEFISLLLDKLLGVGPLLVGLGTLVGLAELEVLAEGKLLLGHLSQVLGVRDALVLRLGGVLSALSILGNSLLQLRLGNLLAGLLVLLLGLALLSTPGLGSLLLGTAGRCVRP